MTGLLLPPVRAGPFGRSISLKTSLLNFRGEIRSNVAQRLVNPRGKHLISPQPRLVNRVDVINVADLPLCAAFSRAYTGSGGSSLMRSSSTETRVSFLSAATSKHPDEGDCLGWEQRWRQLGGSLFAPRFSRPDRFAAVRSLFYGRV